MSAALTHKHIPAGSCMFSAAALSLINAWIVSFPFEGRLLYAFIEKYGIESHGPTTLALIMLAFGLVLGGLLIRSAKAAKRFLLIGIPLCMLCSAFSFFPPSYMSLAALLASSAVSGAGVASWGYFFKGCTERGQRISTASIILIVTASLITLIRIIAAYISLYAGSILSIAILGGAWFFSFRLPVTDNPLSALPVISRRKRIAAQLLMFLFISVITINSGIMTQCVHPAYKGIEWLSSWYWILPFAAAVFAVRRLRNWTDRSNMLYVAIGMIGLAFIFFFMTEHTVVSYLIVYTLMMGGWAVCHLFWWTMLGEMLETGRNPAMIFGIGLSANILGVLHGKLIVLSEISLMASGRPVVALTVICVTLIILPVLHKSLSAILKEGRPAAPAAQEQKASIPMEMEHIGTLTEREKQIVGLMLRGRTCKLIASELYLSENTVKTHIKNIYVKLGIRRKSELFTKLTTP
jgi:DNA-binding CsgD family transcriptional regulator